MSEVEELDVDPGNEEEEFVAVEELSEEEGDDVGNRVEDDEEHEDRRVRGDLDEAHVICRIQVHATICERQCCRHGAR